MYAYVHIIYLRESVKYNAQFYTWSGASCFFFLVLIEGLHIDNSTNLTHQHLADKQILITWSKTVYMFTRMMIEKNMCFVS